MGTREGGVHVLKMNFNREEDACSDVYSSSSAAQSRPSTPAMGEHGLESAAELEVRVFNHGDACCTSFWSLELT